jgi:hypothetical protein
MTNNITNSGLIDENISSSAAAELHPDTKI